MSLPITITYTFGNQTGSIPLSELDADFSLLVNTINGIGDGTIALTTLTVGTINLTNVPTDLPATAGVLWNNGGTLCIS
jgi:hypothetical protein